MRAVQSPKLEILLPAAEEGLASEDANSSRRATGLTPHMQNVPGLCHGPVLGE